MGNEMNDPKVKTISTAALLETVTTLRKVGKLDLAKSLCEKALRREPNELSLINTLALVYFQKNEVDKAETLFHRAIQLQPTNADLFFNLGCLYHGMKAWDKAIETYEMGAIKSVG